MKKAISLLIILAASQFITAQSVLSLDDCYASLHKNYPLASQKALFAQQNKLDLEVINKAHLPQFDAALKTTYQSDVTSVPVHIPGINIPTPNKDQYRTTLTASQLIYQGGLINSQVKLKNLETAVKQSQLNVSLYQLKQQVNQYYFSILLSDDKLQIIQDKENQLQTRIKEIQSAVSNGVALSSSSALLQAELLNAQQQAFEVTDTKKAIIEALSELIGKPITAQTAFIQPKILYATTDSLNRPELQYFKLKQNQISQQSAVLAKTNVPKISAFAQGGYGNPGLNAFDTNFAPFYMVGLQLNWHVFDWHKNKKQRESLNLNKSIIESEKNTFKLNTKLQTISQSSKIKTLNALIKTDYQIIPLRESVLKTAEAQLKHGVITPSDYITELTRFYEAKTNLKTHKIQLEWAMVNYATITGTYQTK